MATQDDLTSALQSPLRQGAINTGTDSRALTKAMSGSKTVPVTSTLDGKTVASFNLKQPTLTSKDVINSMESDRQQQIQAAQFVAQNEQTGESLYRQSLGLYPEFREGVTKSGGQLTTALQRRETEGKRGVGTAAKAAQRVPEEVEIRRQQALADIEKRTQDVMAGLVDTTSNDLEQQRLSIDSMYEEQKRQILANTQNPAEASEAIRRLDAQRFQTLGLVASQVKTQFAKYKTQLQQSYDTMAVQVRQAQDTLAATAGTQSAQTLAQLAQVNSGLLTSMQSEERLAEYGKQELLSTSYLAEAAQDQAFAEYLKNMSAFVFPISDIVSTAYAAQLGEAQNFKLKAGSDPMTAAMLGGNAEGSYTSGRVVGGGGGATQGSPEWYAQMGITPPSSSYVQQARQGSQNIGKVVQSGLLPSM